VSYYRGIFKLNKDKKGWFIVFEGIDGSGKTTQIKNIAARLSEILPNEVNTTFEPSDGPVGKLIRKMLAGQIETDQRTIASLFAADRTDHLLDRKNGICRKLAMGNIVLCDRYYFSSYAYHAQHMDLRWVIQANSLNAEILRPDLNIFIDVEPEVCFDRIMANRTSFDMYEKKDILEAVRANYFKAFEILKHDEKIIIIDGNRSLKQVEDSVFDAVMHLVAPEKVQT